MKGEGDFDDGGNEGKGVFRLKSRKKREISSEARLEKLVNEDRRRKLG